MLSIGEIAHSTGVSRRMLRHWESEGLLVPAVVDPLTGHRRYGESQPGRVRAIAELRALGFGLAEIRELLDPQIGQPQLETLLTHQADVLRQQISEASTRLAHVQHRLDVIRSKSQDIIMHLSLTALPRLELRGLSTDVLDETEISDAVGELRQRMQPDESSAGALVLLYDGSRDDRITVSAGSAVAASAPEATGIITAPAEPDGVSVTFDAHPESIADAWVLIGTELERRNLTTFGIYRQIHDEEGGITLQAPVRTLH